MTKRIILMVLMMAGTVQAQDFIIGDSTNGTSIASAAVLTEAWSTRYNSEGTLRHMMYTAVEGDSITTFNAVYQYGSGDSLLVGLYTATASDTLPDTLINSWYVVMTNNDPQALTTWNIDYPIPSDNWGDLLMVGWIRFEGTGGSVWDADSSMNDACFCMISRDAVPDSLLPTTWVQSSTTVGSPTAWFEGVNVAAGGGSTGVAVGKATLGKVTLGK